MALNIKPAYINGVRVFPFKSSTEVIEYINQHKGILVALNAAKLLHDTHLHPMINRNIGYCDGSGPVLALKQKGIKDAVKIAGCDLWLEMIKAYKAEKTFYLVGATQEVIDKTVAKLNEDFPGIKIAGWRNGFLRTDEDKATLISDIEAKRPDVVFVAMGSPKQEMLMEDLQSRHKAIYMGLGGSFNVYTGNVERAPKWWVDHNMEFAYRLIKEPKRIKRHIYVFQLAWWLLTGKFKREK